MAHKVYELGIQLHIYPKGSIAVHDGSGWRIGADRINTRGNIGESEIYMLLEFAVQAKLTAVLEPLDEEAAYCMPSEQINDDMRPI